MQRHDCRSFNARARIVCVHRVFAIVLFLSTILNLQYAYCAHSHTILCASRTTVMVKPRDVYLGVDIVDGDFLRHADSGLAGVGRGGGDSVVSWRGRYRLNEANGTSAAAAAVRRAEERARTMVMTRSDERLTAVANDGPTVSAAGRARPTSAAVSSIPPFAGRRVVLPTRT